MQTFTFTASDTCMYITCYHQRSDTNLLSDVLHIFHIGYINAQLHVDCMLNMFKL